MADVMALISSYFFFSVLTIFSTSRLQLGHGSLQDERLAALLQPCSIEPVAIQ
jgi:hypothetical protein